MTDDVQMISDGDGLAVIGEPTAVERFLASASLPSVDLRLERLSPSLSTVAGAVQAGSQVSAHSGRWVKLTRESAEQFRQYGLMTNSKTGLSTGVIQAKGGQIKGIVQFAKGPGALAMNPAVLAGAAGIMSQLAMQQAMDDINDYLAVIDEKIEDVLRAQKDGVLADMIGVDLVIEEAMTIREHVGGVSEVTWSKVQATALAITRPQGHALLALDALAEKLEGTSDVGDLAKKVTNARRPVREWLAVLAHCFRLQDGMAVLELDRVLDATPDELDRHRLGLRAARQNRLDLIARSTERLITRMDAAAAIANGRVLFTPAKSRAVVQASNGITAEVHEFHLRLGLERERSAVDARRWLEAAAEVKDRVVETGAEGVVIARQVGAGTVDRARVVSSRLSVGVTRRAVRRPRSEDGTEVRPQGDASEAE